MSTRSLKDLISLAAVASLGLPPQVRDSFKVGKPRRLTGIIGPSIPPEPGWTKSPSRRDKHRAAVAAAKPIAPGPKFAKPRKHVEHVHPLRDEHGAYTLTGRNRKTFFTWKSGRVDHTGWLPGRRTWLAGVSAQRGYR